MNNADLDRAYLSTHARQQMAERWIEWAEILDVLRNARATWRNHRGQTVHAHGDLTVVTADTARGPIVVTVLLNRGEQWSDEDARNRKR